MNRTGNRFSFSEEPTKEEGSESHKQSAEGINSYDRTIDQDQEDQEEDREGHDDFNGRSISISISANHCSILIVFVCFCS